MVGSTLVNNRIRSCDIYEARGIKPLFLGEDDGPLTDGLISDVYLGCARTGSGAGYVLCEIGHAAGWLINSVHSYVHHQTVTGLALPNSAMALYRPWHAKYSRLHTQILVGQCRICSVRHGVDLVPQ